VGGSTRAGRIGRRARIHRRLYGRWQVWNVDAVGGGLTVGTATAAFGGLPCGLRRPAGGGPGPGVACGFAICCVVALLFYIGDAKRRGANYPDRACLPLGFGLWTVEVSWLGSAFRVVVVLDWLVGLGVSASRRPNWSRNPEELRLTESHTGTAEYYLRPKISAAIDIRV
jgi:hypothetical protein